MRSDSFGAVTPSSRMPWAVSPPGNEKKVEFLFLLFIRTPQGGNSKKNLTGERLFRSDLMTKIFLHNKIV